ncbi:hypothetical protein GCM10009663_42390 [Kitasatospora arboriphila]|uniref:Secreted protein n=1 Tax=Kitasatospora arboriphila TaxID=258052 RepID=A0ABN1TMK2_9ACTN
MTRPYRAAEMPARPMSTASVVLPCWATTASSRFTATSAMNRPSRKTVPRPVGGSAGTAPAAAVPAGRCSGRDSGRDSGTRTKTTTAQASVEAASIRNSAR